MRKRSLGVLLIAMLWPALPSRGDEPWYEGQSARNTESTSLPIEVALRRYEHEPTIERLLEAVGRLPELDPEVAHRVRRRARRASLLPRIRLRARRGQGVDLDERVGEIRTSKDDSLTLEAVVEWRLSRTVFQRSEPQLLQQATRRAEARRQRAELVVTVYFERRRLQLERDLVPPGNPQSRVSAELKIYELAALLDTLTGGAFSGS